MNLWKFLVIALLASVALFHVGAVIWIGDRDYQLTSKDYYGQELAYEQTLDQLRAGAAFVWSSQTSLEENVVQVTVKDLNGNGLALEQVSAQLYKPNDASQDHKLQLEPAKEGSYRADSQVLNKGPWKLTVTGTHKGTPVAWQAHIVL